MKRLLLSIALILIIYNCYAQKTGSVPSVNNKKTIRLCCGTPDSTKKIMFVIDGKIFKNNQFPSLDPKLIKNITILKDKETELKYGEDAKNGVIIIDIVKETKWIMVAKILRKNKIKAKDLELPVFFNNVQVMTAILLVNKKSKYKVSVLNSTTSQLKNNPYAGNYLSISETKD